ncbi:hypothetical protein [Streptomyces roseoverticillatus]|uniref:hypothetical protein n=1 Tax=Streptomyces roseoverticillatus TaxID=66429 RepID=UPI000D144D4C
MEGEFGHNVRLEQECVRYSAPLDAQNAARALLSGRARAHAKSGDGPVQIARMYKLAKDDAALHRSVHTRLRVDPRTQDNYERRTKEGKTRREIVRCLKRYAAREAFHLVRPALLGPPS